MAANCLFCRIIAGEIPATKVFEDDRMIAFEDINPQAPMHVLVVPKLHVATLNDLGVDTDHWSAKWSGGARRCGGARTRRRGYRTVFNCNADAGCTVLHLHLQCSAAEHGMAAGINAGTRSTTRGPQLAMN